VAQFALTLLGGFHARLPNGDAVLLPTRKAQALLAYLAVPVGRTHPRDKLAALLWGGIREESARASLRQALFVLRKAVEAADAELLRADGEALSLRPAAVDVDVVAFEQAVREGSAESLERAMSLYQGDLLAGLVLDEAPFEEWLIAERERLHELALEALAKLLAHQRRAGATEAAVASALRVLSLDPLQEPVHRALMRCYTQLGRRGAALRQYQACVGALQRELGIEPDAETKALYREILRERPQSRVPVEDPRPARPTAEAPATDNETMLIGRAMESASLLAALSAARSGSGGVTVVVGEAGIGKSRLVAELIGEATRHGVTILLGRAYESEQILPFGPWVDALRAGRVPEDADLLQRLGPALRVELARLLPELGGASTTAAADIRRVFESIAQAIAVLVTRQPLLIVLEDLHWADEMTARLVAFIGRRLADRPALLVVTAREDELADAPALRQALDDLQRDGTLATVTLPPLSRSDTLALVRALARSGDDVAIARLGEQAWGTSEGNPFVAVETVRAYADGAAVAPGAGIEVPARVREIVSRRLDRLSERGQMLASMAAVIGREFDFALLLRAAGLDEDDTAAGVEELVRRRVLHGIGERFDFTHDRIRGVAYARILTPRRWLLHRRAAEAIEALHAGDLVAHALALGRHYREAQVWEAATRHLQEAGKSAWNRSANREAITCYESALTTLQHLPDGPSKAAYAIDLRIEIEVASMGLGNFKPGLARLAEAEAIAHAAGDQGRLMRVYYRMTYDLSSLGDFAGALVKGEAARALAIEHDPLAGMHGVNVMLARTLYGVGDYRRAAAVTTENIGIERTLIKQAELRGEPRRRMLSLAFSRGWIVLAMAELGEFQAGAEVGSEALEAAGEMGPHQDVWVRLALGRLYAVQGSVDRAVAILEGALPQCEASSDLGVYFSRVASTLGEAYARSGRFPEALTLLERAVEHGETLGFVYSQPLARVCLGEARLMEGHVDEAGRQAAGALEVARRHGQRGSEAWALRLLGEVATRRSAFDRAEAEAHFAAAAALAQERGMRPLLAHCHLGVGETCRRAGEKSRAATAIEAALSAYRSLEMPYWIARAEAAQA
jgi:DNA-binding SARP family transcriptional activator